VHQVIDHGPEGAPTEGKVHTTQTGWENKKKRGGNFLEPSERKHCKGDPNVRGRALPPVAANLVRQEASVQNNSQADRRAACASSRAALVRAIIGEKARSSTKELIAARSYDAQRVKAEGPRKEEGSHEGTRKRGRHTPH